jgi:hypothetical protein
MNIEIPTVSNTSRKDSYSPIFTSCFSTLFVNEQGWSDFFCNYAILEFKNKERINKFLLDLNELDISTKKMF